MEGTRAAQKNQAWRSLDYAFDCSARTQERQTWFQKCDACDRVRYSCDFEVLSKKMLLYIPSCLSFETLLIPFLPSLVANTASICDLVCVLFCFLILFSFMMLNFTSTSSYRVWRFSWEFWSNVFHIIFCNIITTSEIHSVVHKITWYSYIFTTKNEEESAWHIG